MALPVKVDCDLIVVGAGAAGMTAALVAALEGLHVILCESSEQVGGTTATSAGTLWLPGNHQGREAGCPDSVSDASRYLDALVGPEVGRQLRQAFLDTGDEAITWLEQRTEVRFASAGLHPDYKLLPGAATSGRALAPLAFDGRRLGTDFERIRAPIPEFMVLGGMMVGKSDILALVHRWRSWPAFVATARLVLRHAVDRLRYSRGTRLVMGNALVARLFMSLKKAGVDLRFGWRLKALVVETGRVGGATFETEKGDVHLSSRLGVVLASGGIGHDAALRRELGPAGVPFVSLVCESVRGEGITAAREAGAAVERPAHGNFLWQPVSRVPASSARTEGLFPHLFLDRAKPGLLAVDARGHRFVNEASSYHHFVEAMVTHTQSTGVQGAWLVCDAAFVRRYGLGVIPPGTRNLQPWVDRDYVQRAGTLEALARLAGIDAAGLVATVQAFNDAAAAGTDPSFGRGEAPLDRFNGDPSHGPNPCLGAVRAAPFIALRVFAADAASSAGLATDGDGRVLGTDGTPLEGLYACGNDAASVMRGTYPGPGATLGPALVFGYRVGRHAAARAHRSTEPHHSIARAVQVALQETGN